MDKEDKFFLILMMCIFGVFFFFLVAGGSIDAYKNRIKQEHEYRMAQIKCTSTQQEQTEGE